MNNIVYYNSDQQKREDYITDYNDYNYENNLDAIIMGTSIEWDYFNSGYIYSHIDNGQQNPTLRLLSAIINIKPTVSTLDQLISTIISYCNRS